MSIQQNFPAISPSLNLNFARSKTLDPRITFSRTSTATRVNEQGLIEVVSADIPRFDHEYDASTGVVKSLGLLVEESRVNYETYTEDPTQWVTSNMVPTGNNITLPTGEVSTTIEYRGETTDPNSKIIRPTPTNAGVIAGETWCFSIFLKAGTENTVNINLTNNTATEGVRVNSFNMLTGEDSGIVEVNGATNGEFNAVSYPNGWWRISIRCTYSLNASGQQTLIRLKGFSNQVTETTSFSAWGAQLEKGSFPTSYIPNDTGSQTTRNPDSVTMTGDNFSDWYNQSEGTVYADTRMVGVQTGRYDRLWAITNSDFNFQGIGLYIEGPSGTLVYINTITSSTGTLEYSSRYTLSVPDISSSTTPQLKSTLTYSQNYANTSFNGFIGSADTSVNLITADRLLIGQPQRFQGYSCMTVSQLTYYPRRLTNDQLQNLTK